MDWDTLAVAVAGSSGIAGLIGECVRRITARSFTIYTDRLTERLKSEVREELRREAKLFDQQFEALRQVVDLSYRARNMLRDLILRRQYRNEGVESIPNQYTSEKAEHFHALLDLQEKIQEALFTNRVFLPESAFELCHSIKSYIVAMNRLSHLSNQKGDEHFQMLMETARNVDTIYESLIHVSRKHIGVGQ